MKSSDLVEVKTSELSITAIHWLLAEIQGMKSRIYMCPVMGEYRVAATPADSEIEDAWLPTLDWGQCGPLIEEHRVSLTGPGCMGGQPDSLWSAHIDTGSFAGSKYYSAPTALIAACRAIVASKFGDTVQIPAELMP